MSTENILRKVRALLTQAEDSAATPAEARLFSAKAEELIARYAIDLALLESREGTGKPVLRTVVVDGAYAKPKHLLFQVIAKAYGCKAVRSNSTTEQVVGFEGDLDIVETLYASLVLQGANAMVSQPRSDRSFRAAFMYGFASQVGNRLSEMRARVTEEVAGTGTALVLADRSDEVDEAAAEHFGTVRTSRAQARDRGGYGAGTSAANRANLGQTGLGARRAVSA